MIDLHCHTTASDGQHAPHEVIALAASAGVTVLAVTDHDTVAGLEAAREAARLHGIELVAGIEVSAFVDKREVPILGHFIDDSQPALRDFSQLLRRERHARMERMVAKLNELGFPVSMSEVLELAGDAQLGRPHLARVLVARGECLDTKEAFDRFLGDGKPAWVDRYRLPANEAIALIRGAGGTATVAHPGVSKLERHDLEAMARAGLSGLEVHHTDQAPSVREKYLEIARVLSLVPTAGSDFHGEAVAPGRRFGMTSMERAAFEALRARRAPAA